MITNYLISPHPLLQPFADNYMLSTSAGTTVTFNSTWPASTETSLVFCLADNVSHFINNNEPSPLQYASGCVIGLQSACNGNIYFNGVCHRFSIQFKANGFNRLFGTPSKEVVNQLHHIDAVFGTAANSLREKLLHAHGIQEMAVWADQFLIWFLNRNTKMPRHDGISVVIAGLLTNSSLLPVDHYARKANMSVRNFNRRFTEQVGVSVKFYCRLLRFNSAINLKIQKPASNWTSIAHECEYYDQMHMIRDFKEFSNANPGQLFDNDKAFSRPRIDINSSSKAIFNHLNKSLENEQFLTVLRTSVNYPA